MSRWSWGTAPALLFGRSGAIFAPLIHTGRMIDITLPPYNADKTGVVPCYASLALAAATANASPYGGLLYAPAGQYFLEQPFDGLGRNGVGLLGDGFPQTRFFSIGGNSSPGYPLFISEPNGMPTPPVVTSLVPGPGNGYHISQGDSSWINFRELITGDIPGYGQLTVEFFWKPDASNTSNFGATLFQCMGQRLVNPFDGSTISLMVAHDAGDKLHCILNTTGGKAETFSAANAIPIGVTSHIAMVYDGSFVRGFVAGVMVCKIAAPTTAFSQGFWEEMHLGADASSDKENSSLFTTQAGTVDSLRVSNVTRYGGDGPFTPPTTKTTSIDGQTLFLCNFENPRNRLFTVHSYNPGNNLTFDGIGYVYWKKPGVIVGNPTWMEGLKIESNGIGVLAVNTQNSLFSDLQITSQREGWFGWNNSFSTFVRRLVVVSQRLGIGFSLQGGVTQVSECNVTTPGISYGFWGGGSSAISDSWCFGTPQCPLRVSGTSDFMAKCFRFTSEGGVSSAVNGILLTNQDSFVMQGGSVNNTSGGSPPCLEYYGGRSPPVLSGVTFAVGGSTTTPAVKGHSPGMTGNVTAATNATPIVITSAAHGMTSLQTITITGVVGNTAANSTWTITVIDGNTFSLMGSAGNGAYVSGGVWTALATLTGCSWLPTETTHAFLG